METVGRKLCVTAGVILALAPIIAKGDSPAVQMFSYSAPSPCKGALSPQSLDRYLATRDFTPDVSMPPYTMATAQLGRPAVSYSAITQEQAAQLRQEDGSLARLRYEIFNDDSAFTHAFAAWTDGPPVRKNQALWTDLDGDGECDLIGWTFVDNGFGSKGRFQTTQYFIFQQRKGDLRLLDWTFYPCDDEIAFTCGGQKPDALIPVWRKGEARPYLVIRQELGMWISGMDLRVGAGDPPISRDAIAWNPAKRAWDLAPKDISAQLNHFLNTNSPTSSQCVDLLPDNFIRECHLPR